MTPTLRDVARRAGVSVSTASRAISGDRTRPVARETQERVWEAVSFLNYQPNATAQRLAHGVNGVTRTFNIGLVLGNVSYKFSDPFWSSVLNGVDEELVRKEYYLRFAFTVDDLFHHHQRRLINRAYIDGLILAAGVRPFSKTIGPDRTVVIEDDKTRWELPLRADVIAIEKRRAMYAVVEHLVALGRRHIGFLGPAMDGDERAEAVIQALARCDVPLVPEFIAESSWAAEDAYPVAKSLLARHGAKMDALVCACDTIAIGAMRAAKDCGRRLPDDLAITGFDDISFARDLDPPLTTVHVPKTLMGELAVRRLIERIDHPTLSPIIQLVPTTLVVRASCGAEWSEETPITVRREVT